MRGLAVAGALAAVFAAGVPAATAPAATAASAAPTRDYWVAAVPFSWNIVPNGRDAIMDAPVDRVDSIVPTVVYRRFSAHWRRLLPNATPGSADGLVIPGPLLHARVGDRLRVH